jgi:hypothetical protein
VALHALEFLVIVERGDSRHNIATLHRFDSRRLKLAEKRLRP